MGKAILKMWLGYIIGGLLTAAWLRKVVGADIVAYLQIDDNFEKLLLTVMTALTFAWSAREKILENLGLLKALVKPAHTRPSEVRQEVAAEAVKVAGIVIPTATQIKQAFKPTPPAPGPDPLFEDDDNNV